MTRQLVRGMGGLRCVMITRARERGWPWVGRAAGCRTTWGLHG
ncbi:hypothetical protein OG873_04395 [Streptomyces violaceus]|uniref:Uncharacterized protein n=1 Tax=Streptomyces violaceus TaxID=1936 RepID=A0ABZ1P348_STRVL